MNDRDQQALLSTYRPWLRKVAAGMTSHIPQWSEDLAQEGWVAMWRALIKDEGGAPVDYWLKKCAVNRMLSVIRDWQAQCRDVQQTTLVDDWTAFDGAGALEAVEPAYHDGALLAVLNTLSLREREYIYRRFWGDAPRQDLEKIYGRYFRKRWPRLRAELQQRLLMQTPS